MLLLVAIREASAVEGAVDDEASVARVKLLDAPNDSEAIAEALSIDRFKRRELWDRHRLVAEFKAD